MIDRIVNRINSIETRMKSIDKKYSKFVNNKVKKGEKNKKDEKKSVDKNANPADAFKDILNNKKDIKSMIDTGLSSINSNILGQNNNSAMNNNLSNYFSNSLNSFIKNKKKD